MREVWLRSNSRVGWTLIGAGAILAMVGAGLASLAQSTLVKALGGVLLFAGLIALILGARQLLRPRLAYMPGFLLLYLGLGQPVRVPIEIVEAFLIGQGPTHLPGRAATLEATNLVIRISQRAPEWSKHDIPRRLGNWCNHYVTLRGAWCEPLGVDKAQQLNARLHDVTRGAPAREPAR